MSTVNGEDSFDYYCPGCQETLSSSEVNDDRTCKRCGAKTDDELIWGNPNCKHVKDRHNVSGIACAKCSGWFCY